MKDDIIRYGGRLTDLEKKLANAYREAVSVALALEIEWRADALFRPLRRLGMMMHSSGMMEMRKKRANLSCTLIYLVTLTSC